MDIHFQLICVNPRSKVAGSYSKTTVSFVRNYKTVFLGGYANLYSHQQ